MRGEGQGEGALVVEHGFRTVLASSGYPLFGLIVAINVTNMVVILAKIHITESRLCHTDDIVIDYRHAKGSLQDTG